MGARGGKRRFREFSRFLPIEMPAGDESCCEEARGGCVLAAGVLVHRKHSYSDEQCYDSTCSFTPPAAGHTPARRGNWERQSSPRIVCPGAAPLWSLSAAPSAGRIGGKRASRATRRPPADGCSLCRPVPVLRSPRPAPAPVRESLPGCAASPPAWECHSRSALTCDAGAAWRPQRPAPQNGHSPAVADWSWGRPTRSLAAVQWSAGRKAGNRSFCRQSWRGSAHSRNGLRSWGKRDRSARP